MEKYSFILLLLLMVQVHIWSIIKEETYTVCNFKIIIKINNYKRLEIKYLRGYHISMTTFFFPETKLNDNCVLSDRRRRRHRADEYNGDVDKKQFSYILLKDKRGKRRSWNREIARYECRRIKIRIQRWVIWKRGFMHARLLRHFYTAR